MGSGGESVHSEKFYYCSECPTEPALKAVKETQLTDIDNQTASADMIKAAVGIKSFSAYFNQSSFGQWEEEVKNKWKEMYATTIRSAYANCRPASGEQISLH